jgi:Family of unknown function (DUF6433)
MKLGIAEIFKLIGNEKTKAGKIALIRQHYSPTMEAVFQYALDSRIKWILPEGAPPYRSTKGGDTQGMFYKESRRLYLFVEGVALSNPNVKPQRREQLFVEFLETIDGEDAEVVLKMKEKKLPNGITKKLVNEAIPQLEIL